MTSAKKTTTDRDARVIRQGMLWVNGICRHNVVDNECCIDFSCCFPELFEKRQHVRVALFTELVKKIDRRRRGTSKAA